MKKILLDPGHGKGKAHNRGFVQVPGFSDCNEGDQNYIFCANHLKPELIKAGFEVGMTRQNISSDPSLSERGKMGKGYDVLLSSNTNAGGGSGVEIYDSTNPIESIKPLTDRICLAASKVLGIPNRGTKYRKQADGSNYYGILRNGMASHNFIAEWCFHDNMKDASSYLNNMSTLAKEVAKVMAEYFNVQKKPQDKPKETPAPAKVDKPWSADAVSWAKSKGISDGLRLKEPCTREEVITMLFRALGEK